MIDWSKYTIPEIKAELKSRCLKTSGKKADLVDRLTKVIEAELFTPFNKLPPEIRQKIWALALPRRRVVELDVAPGPWGNSYGIVTPNLSQTLNVMLCNKEALDVVSKRYLPNTLPVFPAVTLRHATDNNVPLSPNIYRNSNFHDDVFFMREVHDSIGVLEEHSKNLEHTKAVAFFAEDLDACFDEYGLEALLKCTTLEELIVIEEFRPPPKESNRAKSFATQLFDMVRPPPALEPPKFLKSYSHETASDLGRDLKEYFIHIATHDPRFKQFFEKVEVYFTQLY